MTKTKKAAASKVVQFREYGAQEAQSVADGLRELYAVVYAEPPYFEGPQETADFVARFEEQRQMPGFRLAAACVGDRVNGFCYGFTIATESPMWDTLLSNLDAGESREAIVQPTAFVSELLVRAGWRRRGLGRQLHDRFVLARPERQALLLVHPDAQPAQKAYAAWGWRRVGSGEPFPQAGIYDTMVLPLG